MLILIICQFLVLTFTEQIRTMGWNDESDPGHTAYSGHRAAGNIDLGGQRRALRTACQELREHEPLVPDLEEVRRRARAEWRKKYSDRE